MIFMGDGVECEINYYCLELFSEDKGVVYRFELCSYNDKTSEHFQDLCGPVSNS